MFHPPVLHLENMNPGTRVGIEIEICIKKEKYEKIILKQDPPNSYLSETETYYEFKHGNPFRAGAHDYLDKIILTVDPTCVCKKGFVNAEIISPKMSPQEIPIYFNFLKTVVFDNPKDFYQGETCGIHVHWSNEELMLNNDHKYFFLFFKLINNLRQKLDYKLVNSHFSGRQFFYNKGYKDLTLSTSVVDRENYYIDYEYLEIKNVNEMTIEGVLDKLNSKEVSVYTNESFNKEVLYEKMFQYLNINKEVSILMYHFIFSNLNYFTGNGNLEIRNIDEFIENKLIDFEFMEIENEVIEEYVKKYLRIKLGFDKFKNTSDESIFKMFDDQLINLIYQGIFEESIKDILIKIYTDFYYFNQEGNHLLSHFYEEFKENISKQKQPIKKYRRYTLDDLLDMIMTTQKKLPDISIYNIIEGFHVEMRMFSLDSLLYGKTGVSNENIINELTRFLLYTENFMINVISTLNEVYDSRNEIKRDKLELLEDTLLFGGRHSKNQIKKISRRLFCMELVDRNTNRHLRSPVGKPGKSLKSHRKEKPSTLSFERNSEPSLRKSKKKSKRAPKKLPPIPEENKSVSTKPSSPLLSKSGRLLSKRQSSRAKNKMSKKNSIHSRKN